MFKQMNDNQLATLLELVDSRRADVQNGIYVVGNADEREGMIDELTALYDHLNNPDNEIPQIEIPAQRSRPVEFV